MHSDNRILALRQLYCSLLREIRIRMESIDLTLQGKNPIAAFTAFEFCYLQFRLICEALALACLAVHGDIPATKSSKLRLAYRADLIMKHLETLHPNFYPIPSEIKLIGPMIYRAKKLTGIDYLKKGELLSLYFEADGVLHRKSINTVEAPLSIDFLKIQKTYNKLVMLLAQHQILLSDKQVFLVTLSSREHGGEVFAALSQPVEQ